MEDKEKLGSTEVEKHNGTPVESSVSVQDATNLTVEENRRRQNHKYIVGWPLRIINLALLLSLFISQMESSVTSSSILAITNHLGGYTKSSWVFTAYLLTTSGLPIMWAKLSDVIGRKVCLVASQVIFVIASVVCGASQDMVQLIMFRWVQGIGGSGIYSIAILVSWELLPPEKWASNMTKITAVIALSLIFGPLIGGAITETGTWRWIFFLNIPIGAICVALLQLLFPWRLSNEPAAIYAAQHEKVKVWSWRQFRRLDFLGSTLLLGCSVLLTTGLENAAQGTSFRSPLVWTLLLVASLLFPIFLVWQWYVTTRRTYPEPVFPWRFCLNRLFIGMILNAFLTGFVVSVCIVQIPQRYMTVNGLNPLNAGVRLLPFGALFPAGGSLSAFLMGTLNVPPTFMITGGAILELIGITLTSRLDGSLQISTSQYGYDMLIGAGCGFVTTAAVLLIPSVLENRDLAVGNATIAQFRVLGGTLGIAIVTSASNRYVASQLQYYLPDSIASNLLDRTDTINKLSVDEQAAVRPIFAKGYNLQMKILIGIAAAHLVGILLLWKKTPIRVGHGKKK